MIHSLLFPTTMPFTKRQQSKSLILKCCVLLYLGLFCLQGAQAHDIDHVDASFSVEYNGKPTQGEVHLAIQRDHDRYQVAFELDHWLLSSSQKASFKMDDCQVQPISYRSTNKRPFKGETVQTLAFDWGHKQAKYTSGDQHKTFSLESPLYDPLSFFFEARCALEAGQTDLSYPLIYKGKKDVQRYKVVGTETVETGQGPVQALVVERQRSSKTRQTRLYVAPSLDYLLVKISHQENRLVKIVATLKSMDYQLADN